MAELLNFSSPRTVLPRYGAYSHAAVVSSPARLLFTAGQVGETRDGVLPPGVEAQYEVALRNIYHILADQGSSPAARVKLATSLVSPIVPDKMRSIRDAVFGNIERAATLCTEACRSPISGKSRLSRWSMIFRPSSARRATSWDLNASQANGPRLTTQSADGAFVAPFAAIGPVFARSNAEIVSNPHRRAFTERVARIFRCFPMVGALGALMIAAPAHARTPPLPTALPVPPTSQPPLSSALRSGPEFSALAKAGYVEEEYYLAGVAPAITAAGETLFEAPYVTRILIRKPADPAKFNGTVVIEPFSWFGERGAGWILTRDYLLRKGYAYAGYTLNINAPARDPKFPPADPAVSGRAAEQANPYAAIVNFEFMRRFDYARYAPLGTYYDPVRFTRGGAPDPFVPQSQAIGAQLALLLKSNDPKGPMGKLRVERIYVNSWAVTAQVWMDYLDQGRHQSWRMPDGRPLIDAYMTGRMAYGEVGGDVVRVPRKMPQDAPFVTVYSQSELMHDAMEGIALPPDTDRPQLRYYEVTGMPHLRLADLGTGHHEYLAADVGKGDDPRCRTLYVEPAEVVIAALLEGMDKWVREGKAMPRADRVVRQGKGVARDAVTRNMIGGIRPPWILAPSAEYLTEQETNCGIVYDTKLPYSARQLRKLYGSYSGYVGKFEAAKAAAIKQGYLLLEDAGRVKPVAQPEDFRLPLVQAN